MLNYDNGWEISNKVPKLAARLAQSKKRRSGERRSYMYKTDQTLQNTEKIILVVIKNSFLGSISDLTTQQRLIYICAHTSVFEQPICANGHGHCTASQSPTTGS